MKTQIKTRGIELPASARARVQDRIRAALGRFEDRIQEVQLRVADINGPRGGVDKSCLVQVSGPRLSVVLEHRHEDVSEAISCALRRATRTVARRIESNLARPRAELRGAS